MKTVFLLTSIKNLCHDVAAALPDGWTVIDFPSLAEIENYVAHVADLRGMPFPVLVDSIEQMSGGKDTFSRLHQQNGIIYAIVKDSQARNEAFLAGADDCLLAPLDAREMKVRLFHFTTHQNHTTMEADQDSIKEKNEHLASIGRLTSHIVHEINNPMQAIRGAVTLALEEPNIPDQVMSYLNLCQMESQRVVKLVERMRQLYRPRTTRQSFDLGALVTEALATTADEFSRIDVTIHNDLPANLPPAEAILDQIYLALVCILLNMSDLLEICGGGTLTCSGRTVEKIIQVDISAEPPSGAEPYPSFESFPDLTLAKKIISKNDGLLDAAFEPRKACIRIGIQKLDREP